LWGPSFTPDGSSLVYTDPGGAFDGAEMRTVSVAGGQSTILFGGGHGGMGHADSGSMSPDGSLVTMMGNEVGGPGAIRFVADADGTELRHIRGRASNPAGTWSPDWSRIACLQRDRRRSAIIVVDIATGDTSRVAEGSGAIWLDGHTLLVEA
jgi:Tol biopolymer transport system component